MLTDLNPLLTLAIVLLAGVAGGLVSKRMGLPGVTGQITAGVIIGHSGFDLFADDTLNRMGVLTDFALAFIAVSVGSHLNFKRLHNAGKRLRWLLLAESTITPAVTFGLIMALGGSDWRLAILLSAMAVSTAPATILALVAETRSKGVFVKTLIAAVALNNVACIVLFEVARVVARPSDGVSTDGPNPFLLLAGAVALGMVGAFVLLRTTRGSVSEKRITTFSLVAILTVSGLAAQFSLSAMLACLIMGATAVNLSPLQGRQGVEVFEGLVEAIYAAFFTLAGVHLNFENVLAGGLLTVAVFLGRAAGKTLAADLSMRLAKSTDSVRKALSQALIPQAGVAVGLILVITRDAAFSDLHRTLLAVGLTTVMLNEIVGPVLTKRALRASGEMGKDRRRVIDFIYEEHINTDLKARTLDEAIDELSDLLIRTNSLDVDRGVFVRSVRDREAEMSTCVGGGLAVPHARLPDGGEISGALGISRQGLTDETPDGRPVHLVVLLATTDALSSRHLQVLGAFARGLTEGQLADRLAAAKSPAHVYEMLHCRDAEAFNYFLEPEDTRTRRNGY